VFTGIGEFTIHKEFVSAKVAGEVASVNDRALDRLLDFAGEVGLVSIIHNDIATPFYDSGKNPEPINLIQMKDLLRRHPRTTIIWAHLGLGRIIHPVQNHAALIEEILNDAAYSHVYFDLSWDEVAKYIVATPATAQRAAQMINRYPDRFLFGTDVVAPRDTVKYFKTYHMYDPLWQLLTPAARQAVRLGNYERLFDTARSRVRAWEKANAHSAD
jgi:predicted TIM-barrel fold metal-dependent hydrolase